jgi:hypothetical protein
LATTGFGEILWPNEDLGESIGFIRADNSAIDFLIFKTGYYDNPKLIRLSVETES